MKKKFNPQEAEKALGDITGVFNVQTGQNISIGLSREKIPLSEKIKLNLLANKLGDYFKVYEKTKKQLIDSCYPKGLTKEDENKLAMSGNKAYLKMINSISELYNSKDGHEIEFQSISVKKIENLVSENDYSWLLSKIGD